MKKGIIGGTSFFSSDILSRGKESRFYTIYGPCDVVVADALVFIPRHGRDGTILPHNIDHHKHIAALKKAGVEGIVSFGSVGSLKPDLKPGSVLLIDNCFSPFKLTTHRNRVFDYTVPEMVHDWRNEIAETLSSNGIKFVDGGVYAETFGPRFETAPEITYLQDYADVVGMTCASETILAQELKIPHSIIAIVDNFANGVVENPLSGEAFKRGVEENRKRVETIFSIVARM